MCTSRKNEADPSLDVVRIAVASSDGVTIDEHFRPGNQLPYEVLDDGTYRYRRPAPLRPPAMGEPALPRPSPCSWSTWTWCSPASLVPTRWKR